MLETRTAAVGRDRVAALVVVRVLGAETVGLQVASFVPDFESEIVRSHSSKIERSSVDICSTPETSSCNLVLLRSSLVSDSATLR
jgi:hypothetical protein